MQCDWGSDEWLEIGCMHHRLGSHGRLGFCLLARPLVSLLTHGFVNGSVGTNLSCPGPFAAVAIFRVGKLVLLCNPFLSVFYFRGPAPSARAEGTIMRSCPIGRHEVDRTGETRENKKKKRGKSIERTGNLPCTDCHGIS